MDVDLLEGLAQSRMCQTQLVLWGNSVPLGAWPVCSPEALTISTAYDPLLPLG